jgi:hypothetical protein
MKVVSLVNVKGWLLVAMLAGMTGYLLVDLKVGMSVDLTAVLLAMLMVAHLVQM